MRQVLWLIISIMIIASISHGSEIELEKLEPYTNYSKPSSDSRFLAKVSNDGVELIVPSLYKDKGIFPINNNEFYGRYIISQFIYSTIDNTYYSYLPKENPEKYKMLAGDSANTLAPDKLKKIIFAKLENGALSSNGKQIAVIVDTMGENGFKNLFIYDIDKQSISGVFKEKTDFVYACQPAWSPDNKSIAFFACSQRYFIEDSPKENGSALYIVNVETGDYKAITKYGERISAVFIRPSWSPDGKNILIRNNFAHPSGEEPFTYIVNVNDGEIKLFSSIEKPGTMIDTCEWVDNESLIAIYNETKAPEKSIIKRENHSQMLYRKINEKDTVSLLKVYNNSDKTSAEQYIRKVSKFAVSPDEKKVFVTISEMTRELSDKEKSAIVNSAFPYKKVKTTPLFFELEDLKTNPMSIKNSDELEKIWEKNKLHKNIANN